MGLEQRLELVVRRGGHPAAEQRAAGKEGKERRGERESGGRQMSRLRLPPAPRSVCRQRSCAAALVQCVRWSATGKERKRQSRERERREERDEKLQSRNLGTQKRITACLESIHSEERVKESHGESAHYEEKKKKKKRSQQPERERGRDKREKPTGTRLSRHFPSVLLSGASLSAFPSAA